ncbi:uncharacterized protein [Diabrotica undecimpunctata]|uniref:uncharacterized protein n=1 Tax=Diabrotica undecimpunctata TaxID=50387 RepID=UPI003B6342B3
MKTILILALLSCVALTIYARETTSWPESEPTYDPDEYKCDVCITFATIIKDYVYEKVPLEELEKDADRLCHDLPHHLKEICEKDLLPNLDKIYEGLHGHNPEDLCEHLHYCGRP